LVTRFLPYSATNLLSAQSMTYPDGNYIAYFHDNLSRPYYSSLNGAHELINPHFDSLGRLETVYRLNPATVTWGADELRLRSGFATLVAHA
jgi:hypothetical protein